MAEGCSQSFLLYQKIKDNRSLEFVEVLCLPALFAICHSVSLIEQGVGISRAKSQCLLNSDALRSSNASICTL
jgi:hypothetical protein